MEEGSFVIKEKVHVGVIDIDEQDEVIEFLTEALEKGHHSFRDRVAFEAFQLKPHGEECDYDFGAMEFSTDLHLLFWHTKTLKGAGRHFKDSFWFKPTLESMKLAKNAKIWFYSGDIEEFIQHLNWMKRQVAEPLFRADLEVKCIDVFDLLYPQDMELEEWLVSVIRY
jgi:hypothetical protein